MDAVIIFLVTSGHGLHMARSGASMYLNIDSNPHTCTVNFKLNDVNVNVNSSIPESSPHFTAVFLRGIVLTKYTLVDTHKRR